MSDLENDFSERFNQFNQELMNDHDRKRNFEKLVAVGQTPDVMIIGCADSRGASELLFQADLGDIFTSRHIANLVIPYDPEKVSENPIAGAVEMAVNDLKVKDIIIKGHTGCGGINALVNIVDVIEKDNPDNYRFSDAEQWVLNAKDVVIQNKSLRLEPDFVDQISKHVLLWSLNNLKEYPSVKESLENGTLNIHAWCFDMKNLEILRYDEEASLFVPIADNNRSTQISFDFPYT